MNKNILFLLIIFLAVLIIPKFAFSLDCAGPVTLSLNPTSAIPSSSVTATAAGLTGCSGKIVTFQQGTCSGTLDCADISSCAIDTSGTTCNIIFSAPFAQKATTIWARVKVDSGETVSFATLKLLPVNKKVVTVSTDGTATQNDLIDPINHADLTTTSTIFQITGNLLLSDNISGNKTGVIFVNGDLTINPTSDKLTYDYNDAGLVFVVKGNVNIYQSITQIDAIIISEGIICTAYDLNATPPCPTNNVSGLQPLVINGSLISLNQTEDVPIKFKRSLGANDSTTPAEKIVWQPKYLVILRDLMSDTLQRWSEIP